MDCTAGLALAALDQYCFRGRAPWTLRYRRRITLN